MENQKRPVQYFTEEYLERSSKLNPDEIADFLEQFRILHTRDELKRSKSKLISIKVPEDLLEAFKAKAALEGVPYQTMIKRLMREWMGA